MMFTIIIPAYNSLIHLKKGIYSIINQPSPFDLEVIVIDNGSQDGTYEFIKEKFPSVKIIKNKDNKGTSMARNQGIKLSSGRYLMFMDADVELSSNFFIILERHLKNLPSDIGAISPKIIDKNTKKIFSCGLKITSIYRAYDVGKNKNPEKFLDSFFIDGPNTCCGIFRRETLEAIKSKNGSYFDENIFFLFEDVDMALRLKKKGIKSIFIPELICIHQGNSSSTPSNLRQYLCFRNRLYIIIKNYRRNLFKFFIKSMFYELPRTIYLLITNKLTYKAIKELSKWIKNEKDNNI